MELIINNYQNALLFECSDLEKGIEESFGIKTIISKNDDKLYVAITHYQSCFTLMTKLRWDFDYSVHKKVNLYIIDISHCDVDSNLEEAHRIKFKKQLK